MIADMIIQIYSGLYIIGFFSLALPMAFMLRKAIINFLEL